MYIWKWFRRPRGCFKLLVSYISKTFVHTGGQTYKNISMTSGIHNCFPIQSTSKNIRALLHFSSTYLINCKRKIKNIVRIVLYGATSIPLFCKIVTKLWNKYPKSYDRDKIGWWGIKSLRRIHSRISIHFFKERNPEMNLKLQSYYHIDLKNIMVEPL